MSPVIYTPPPPHDCQPPMYRSAYGGSSAPVYRPNTIWACDDCGQRWIVASKTYMDTTLDDHRAGLIATRTWWEHHHKDTP